MIELNENYWDCECEEDYIHKTSEDRYCPKCDCISVEQPDSRQNEIDALIAKNYDWGRNSLKNN